MSVGTLGRPILYLGRPRVASYVKQRVDRGCAQHEATGAELLERLAAVVRLDVRDMFDHTGKPLPPHLWPPGIAQGIESFELRGDGAIRIKFSSRLQATRMLLEALGALKDPLHVQTSALAKAIRADLGLSEQEPGDTVQ